MKRAILIICGALIIVGIAYTVSTHPHLERVDHLRSELAKLEAQNQQLAQENEDLEKTIIALRDDPRLAERRARGSGMARPGEVVFQFEEPEKDIAVEAWLNVGVESGELAGKTVSHQELGAALDTLKSQIPGASLRVSFEDEVDAIQRQFIIDSIEGSAFGGAKYSE